MSTLILGCGTRSPGQGDTIGIAECDEYSSKMTACMARDPRAKAMEAGFRAQRDAWKQMGQRDRGAAQANCRSALESLGRAMPTCM